MAAAERGGARRRAATAGLALLALCSAVPLRAAATPQLVALVLDTSGSIGPRDQALRRRTAEGVLRSLPAGSELALFAFDDNPRLILRRTADRDEVARAVAGLGRAGRYTALYDAIFDASRYLADETAERKSILLVTDGMDENSALNLEDALATARELGIPVYAVGVGRVQERVLRRIAKLTGGDYFGAGAKPAALAERIATANVRVPRAAATTSPAEAARRAAREAAAVQRAPAPAQAGAPEKTGAEASRGPEPRGVVLQPWLVALPVAAILLLALVVGLVLVSRRKPAAPAEPQPATRRPAPAAAPAEAAIDDDEEAEYLAMARRPEGGQTTLVLTLLPLLRVVKGPASGKMFEVSGDKATTIGRAKDNDVVIDDRAISNRHCRIRPVAGGFEIVDLRSTNGTFVNQRRVARQPLGPGDVIKVGESNLEFRMDHLKSE